MAHHKEVVDLMAEVEKWRTAERQLSAAYLRLRLIIPGALMTPTAPTPQQVWDTTELALIKALNK